ncbi:uncharacterized protein [Amphiura filiformis]|uniref:uncharacterized protein isoform X2 n=1 Tax=Amphiura filiformis TaxID=82378 RepID=UPI003B20CE40
MIPPMDSDEENDDVYDDTAPPPLPDIARLPQSFPPPPHLPPSRSPLPSRHSPLPNTPENSGGDGDFDLTYDDVSNPSDGEAEQDELYEAVGSEFREELQHNEDGISIASGVTDEGQDVSAKELEAQRKREEKQRKEQEKQQKREEEKRKKEEEKKEKERQKKEKEDKKRREKEEKEAKKKFGIKGDIEVIERRTVVINFHADYADKLDLSVTKGDELEVLRKDGNPPGKWLARDLEGRYGYVSELCVEVGDDTQDVYDDVAAVATEDAEGEEIYDVPDTE